MSLSAILLTARDFVRSLPDVADNSCDVQPDGQPPPQIGQVFYSVHPLYWRPSPDGDPVLGIEEEYGFAVTITRRTPVYPKDRVGTNLFLAALTGLENNARNVMGILHQDASFPAAVNIHIEAIRALADQTQLQASYFPVISMPKWQGTDAIPTPRDAEWFSSSNPNFDRDAGMSLEVRFGGVIRPSTQDAFEFTLPEV